MNLRTFTARRARRARLKDIIEDFFLARLNMLFSFRQRLTCEAKIKNMTFELMLLCSPRPSKPGLVSMNPIKTTINGFE